MTSPSLSELVFLHEALFGFPPDSHSSLDFLLSLPTVRNAALAMLNSPRYRFESRVEVPLWPYDKWVMTALHGLDIWVNLNDRFIALTILDGHYEEELVAEVLKRLPEGGVMIDAGANVGAYTLQAARRVGSSGSVHAFEPQAEIFKHLKMSVEANGFADRCRLHRSGLSNRLGTASMNSRPGNPGANNIVPVMEGDSATVTLEMLDDVDFGPRVDYVKIDVEGFESKLLTGGREFFARHRPHATSEVFPERLRLFGGSSAEEYLDLWESLNYRVLRFEISGDHQVIRPVDVRDESRLPYLFNILLEPL